MADDSHRNDYPQHRPKGRYPPPSQYPPPPDAIYRTEDNKGHAGMAATSVSLPSMHNPRALSYGPPPPGSLGYPSDHRYASPSAVNSYPPPPPPPGQQPPSSYLSPPQQHLDPHGGQGYRSPDPYPPSRQQPSPYAQEPQYRHADPYYYQQKPQGPPGPPSAYYHQRPYAQEFGPPRGGPQVPQAAPRQRTSIACKYCRKRKVSC